MNKTFKQLRKERGYTQAYLAGRLGIEQSTVAMWERGKSTPRMETLIRLGEIFRMEIPELYLTFPAANK